MIIKTYFFAKVLDIVYGIVTKLRKLFRILKKESHIFAVEIIKNIIRTMGKLLEQLKSYFENTPAEVLEKECAEWDYLNEIGPDVLEYAKNG